MDLSLLVDMASWALLAVGGFFCVTAGLGLLRLPDFFSRGHNVLFGSPEHDQRIVVATVEVLAEPNEFLL